jgi:hypothetical protein
VRPGVAGIDLQVVDRSHRNHRGERLGQRLEASRPGLCLAHHHGLVDFVFGRFALRNLNHDTPLSISLRHPGMGSRSKRLNTGARHGLRPKACHRTANNLKIDAAQPELLAPATGAPCLMPNRRPRTDERPTARTSCPARRYAPEMSGQTMRMMAWRAMAIRHGLGSDQAGNRLLGLVGRE